MRMCDVQVGMRVIFGRENGEKTLGEVVKINPKRVKVRTLEGRGQLRHGRKGAVKRTAEGAVWLVPPCLMEMAS